MNTSLVEVIKERLNRRAMIIKVKSANFGKGEKKK